MTTQLYKDICLFLRDLIRGTQWEGHVFTVGGCCRDLIMEEPIKDVDLAVTAPDGGIAFAMWLYDKGLTVGEPTTFPKYGTARLSLKAYPDEELELVQTRKEKYTDRNSRDPSTAFGTIEEDCFRRDLTINSLYYDISRDCMLDLTGRGIADMKEKIIRTPSDPDMTFDDDPVRILRAIRFAAKFGWEIDPAAMSAMCRYVDRLSIISPERMQGEFEKILICPRPAMALELLRKVGAIPYIMPELCKTFDMPQTRFHTGTVWEHILEVVDKVHDTPLLRTAALLHDIGKVSAFTRAKDGTVSFPRHDRRARGLILQMMNRLRYRSTFIDRVLFLCLHHEAAKSWGPEAREMTDADLRRLQWECHTRTRMDNLLSLIDADNRSYAPDYCMPHQVEAIRRRSAELRADGTAMFGYHLPVKPSRACRMKRIRVGDKAYDECIRYLLALAFDDPLMPREVMARKLERYNPPALAARRAARADARQARNK